MDCCWSVVAILLLLPILYEISPAFKYWAKFLFYYIYINVVSLVLIPVCLLRPKNVVNYRIVTGGLHLAFRMFGITTEVRGEDNLISDQPCILVCNHQSSLDLIGMCTIWPERCTSIAKKTLKYAGTIGFISYLCDTIYIDRLNHDKARETMNETVRRIKSKKVKVWIFPEGTRNNDGAMLPFKKGAFHLAIQAQIPIVPVVFSSYSGFLSKKPKKFNGGKIIITCLPPIPTEGLSSGEVNELTEKTRKLMIDVFNDTSIEISQQQNAVFIAKNKKE